MKIQKYFFLFALLSVTSAFSASDPKGYKIDGTIIVMYRVTCANGDWVDFNTYDLAKANGGSSCRGMGSSLVDVKQRPGPGTSWGKDPSSVLKPAGVEFGRPLKNGMRNN